MLTGATHAWNIVNHKMKNIILSPLQFIIYTVVIDYK